MKLGINDKTGQNWSLTSWLSYSLPSPGAFTLEWYPLEEELIVKRRGVDFWTSGTFFCSSFENIEAFTATANYFFRKYSDQDEKYLNYTAAPCYQKDGNSVTSLWLTSDGSLVDTLTRKYLFKSLLCDGNTTDFGCKRWEDLSCRHGQKLERKAISNNDPQIIRVFDNRTNLSLSDCKDMCWKNCTCVGVQEKGPNPDGTGCTFLSGPLKEMKNGGSNLTIPNPDEAFYIIIPAPSEKQSIWKWILISVATAAALVVIFFLGFFLFIRWRRLRLEEKFLFELMSEAKELEIDGKKGVNLKVYSVSSIMDATNSFSSENKLGEGGFGPVYKGLLPDGQEIAIKRLSGRSRQGLVEFKNELIIVAKLQHTTLVRLLGFCIQEEEKILVYEYMPNKSLDSYIFDSKRELFDWDKCFNIIEEIAQGLLYLHKYSRLTIIHRDLKSGNILLDKNMNPKISDFGMAKIFATTESDANTNRIVGTRGYMAPEYARDGIFSTKSDIFSFGVLVLEIISGRRSNSIFYLDQPLNLVGYAWELWREEHNPVDRPSMSAVICMLGSDVVKLTKPKQPAFSTED
ncbi:putative receptor-like protein kinase At4g00960, partial [Pistacia vera]|uniref:putative receptor-like protein kinase At4g00960 n=1 Tax=Pistacia vera TaxID=55513 RepID=UPI0012635198